RHTRSKRDWSSDVCSSDLEGVAHSMWSWMSPRTRRVMIGPAPATTSAYPSRTSHFAGVPSCDCHCERSLPSNSTMASDGGGTGEIGRASCRERVEVGGGGV